jgi:hypothetical protein
MRKNSLMPAAVSRLLELQIQLRQAVLGGDTAEIVAAIRGDELDPAARIGIYRNHAFAILSASLRGTFPVICRLVDERFFAYAAHEYLREHPPRSRCLVEYGADFADFLADFEPCKALPYLADVARFEWALNIAAKRAGSRSAAPAGPCRSSNKRGRICRASSAALAQLRHLPLADRRDLAGEPGE